MNYCVLLLNLGAVKRGLGRTLRCPLIRSPGPGQVQMSIGHPQQASGSLTFTDP